MANIDGTLVYVFNNQTGNVEALYKADSSNELLAEYEYTPFGETRRQSGELAAKNPLRYSTRYQEGNTDLYYYGFRHYSPVTKKWLSQDPLEENGGFNMYQFAGNDPINGIDVLGLCCKPKRCKVKVRVGHGDRDGRDSPVAKQTRIDARQAARDGTFGTSSFTIPVCCATGSIEGSLMMDKPINGHDLNDILPPGLETSQKDGQIRGDDRVFDDEGNELPHNEPIKDGNEPFSNVCRRAIKAIKSLCKLECVDNDGNKQKQCTGIDLQIRPQGVDGKRIVRKNPWWIKQLEKAARCAGQ